MRSSSKVSGTLMFRDHIPECVFRQVTREGVTVLWIDNFSKCYAVALQGAASGAFKNCQWTGIGFKAVAGGMRPIFENVWCSQHPLCSHGGMPEDVFDRKLINGAKDQFCQTLRAHGWLHFRHSLVKRFAVNTIPPKPVVPRDHELYAVLKESRDGLIHFYPWRMSPLNVGSNRGLLKMLKEIDDGIACDAPIRFLVADCNIFVRIMKVRSPRHASSQSGIPCQRGSLDLPQSPRMSSHTEHDQQSLACVLCAPQR